ncbi:hypothetical protein BH10PAT4_BH10PAT4_1030 [soil metagenome]
MQTLTHDVQKQVRFIVSALMVLAVSVLPLVSASQASAAQITARKLTIGSSAPSASSSYTFTFTVPTSSLVRSAAFVACDTPSGTCTMPAGFSASAAVAAQPTNLGDASGWVTTDSTATELRLSKAGNVANPTGSQTVVFSSVTNPSTANATFFIRMTTYTNANWTTAIDSGVVAASTAAQIAVSLQVDEALTFCTGTSITGTNCGTAAGSTVNLGIGSTTATSSGTSIMAASTNAANGYTITVSGATLTSGINTITALTSGATSSVGVKQFGLNLVANTTPSVGTGVTGSGTATAVGNYGTSNTFRLGTGESVATIGGVTNANTFTVSYIANIDGSTPAGNYTTTLTYVATPNF